MITIRRLDNGATRHVVSIRAHEFLTDLSPSEGGADAGPTPHDLYDAALGACKALTALWFAERKGIPLEDIEVAVVRDDSAEREGIYRLKTVLTLGGDLSAEERAAVLAAAAKCPVHKLMTKVTTEIETSLAGFG